MPTAAARTGGGPPDGRPQSFAPGAAGAAAHRTVTGIDVVDGRMVLHEGERSIDVPLTEAWTDVDDFLAASAATRPDGRLVVDLAFVATPHRLEVELDPATGTFATHWPNLPLFGPGVDNRLSSMRAPS
jgi:hypothetical protein